MITSIPIIDLAKISHIDNAATGDWENVASEIRKALHEVGFMYLVNHGVPNDIIAENFKISEEFFALPREIKKKYKKNLGKVEMAGSNREKNSFIPIPNLNTGSVLTSQDKRHSTPRTSLPSAPLTGSWNPIAKSLLKVCSNSSQSL